MIENGIDAADSAQAEQIKDLDQQIVDKKASLAEQNRLLRSARDRFRAYSTANRHANHQQQRRKELWAKIVEQPHHKYLDSGQLPNDDGSGIIVDLVLDINDHSRTKFISWKPPEKAGDEPEVDYSEILTASGRAYLPQQVDANLLKSIRMPFNPESYESLSQLISDISQLILRCVAITDTDARLLAHFVLSTWLIDRLPVAPYLALVGPPQSGKTTLLRVLHLLCRRSLFASDATSLTLLHACHQLHPTLLIDETSSIDDPVALRRLLRIGNTPDSLVLRHKQAWNVFGPKVICWRELPDDAALNSRCIILPMHAVNDPALRLPDDPEIVSAGAALQSQLLEYRLANYNRITVPANDDAIKSFPPRKREMYLALAGPCMNDEPSRVFLLDYFRDSRIHLDDPLSAVEHALLAALFHSAHLPQNRGQLLITDLTAGVNRYLQEEGERRQVTARHVGALLAGFGFTRRRRMNSGWALLLEREDPPRLHQMAEHYGTTQRHTGFVACSLCPDAPPAARPLATGVMG